MDEPSCESSAGLTDVSVVQLRRHVGMNAVLCFLPDVVDDVIQGGYCHLQTKSGSQTEDLEELYSHTCRFPVL